MSLGGIGEPAAIESIFGWVLGGPNPKGSHTVLRVRTSQVDSGSEPDPDDMLQRFWKLEDGGISDVVDRKAVAQASEGEVYRAFKATTRWIGERYQVRLPWKEEMPQMPNNFAVAFECLKRSERKHKHNQKALKVYVSAIREYEQLGFAEVVPEDSSDETKKSPDRVKWYLPHHAVVREDRETTKVRIVFNGASKFNGVSLNARLHTGPSLLPSIIIISIGIILRFRTNEVAFIADIRKMFLQISVHPEDRDALRYLWRDKDGQLQIMRFTRVIFGTNCSPFLAIGTVHNHCDLKREEYPKVTSVVKRDMYMDDLASGAKSVAAARDIVDDCRKMLLEGGFELTKWTSNESEALGNIQFENLADVMGKPAEERIQKILGVVWRLGEDVLGVQVDSQQESPPKFTKRSLLKDVAAIFDPLGIVSPFTTIGRILLQDCWKSGVKWDGQLPGEIEADYKVWRDEIPGLSIVKIKRHLLRNPPISETEIELHGFGDASERAYGAVVYIKYQAESGTVTEFLLSKGRVAPIKGLTLPRLELTAALLTAKLLIFVQQELNLPIEKSQVYAWSDSEITLHWIVGGKSTDRFVTARTEKICAFIPPSNWRHCPGKLNPADVVSRGAKLGKLLESSEWLEGPKWLAKTDVSAIASEKMCKICLKVGQFARMCCTNDYEMIRDKEQAVQSEAAASVNVAVQIENEKLLDVWKFPLHKSLTITAFVMRFVTNTRKPKDERICGMIRYQELHGAERFWIRDAQNDEFQKEIRELRKKQAVPKESSLRKLDPILDDEGLIHVGGRIQHAQASYSAKHPIILPRGSKIAVKLVEAAHEVALHASTDHLLSILRRTYWIPKGRSFVKSIVNACPKCRVFRAKPMAQKMGNLPLERVMIAAPFTNCGVDFAGPMNIKQFRSQDGEVEVSKAYICLFVCMAVRAIHLELVTDLSVDKFLQALRRMNSRRGPTKLILSDNAKTFKAAERILKQAGAPLSKRGIEWRFIPERAPWQGGMYERLVKSVKTPLRRILGSSLLTYEELNTVLCEVEGQVNSRPLTTVSDDVSDFAVITPSHFLAGREVSTADLFDTSKVGGDKSTLKQRWRHMKQVAASFWKRWHSEYLLNLQQRSKWQTSKVNLQIDDVVLIEDESLPRGSWPIGRVIQVTTGRDGLVRSALVRKKNGKEVRRPIQRLYQLEKAEDA